MNNLIDKEKKWSIKTFSVKLLNFTSKKRRNKKNKVN